MRKGVQVDTTAEVLPFFSRHQPTLGQERTARVMGYDTLDTRTIVWGGDPVGQLLDLGISRGTAVSGVFPAYVAVLLVEAGWTVIEFQNCPDARARGEYVCIGAISMERFLGDLFARFVECPLPAAVQMPVSCMVAHP